jgi:hypothetical protein
MFTKKFLSSLCADFNFVFMEDYARQISEFVQYISYYVVVHVGFLYAFHLLRHVSNIMRYYAVYVMSVIMI